MDGYKYLGIYLGRSGSFVAEKKHIAEQANKELFSLLKKIRSHARGPNTCMFITRNIT